MGLDIYACDETGTLPWFSMSYSRFMFFRCSVMRALGYNVIDHRDSDGNMLCAILGQTGKYRREREFVKVFWNSDDSAGRWTWRQCGLILSVLRNLQGPVVVPWCPAVSDVNERLTQFRLGLEYCLQHRVAAKRC